MLVILYICLFFFLSHKHFIADFSPAIRATVFKFCIHPDNGEICCVRENQDGEIFFFFAHLSRAKLRETYIYKKIMAQHIMIAITGGM